MASANEMMKPMATAITVSQMCWIVRPTRSSRWSSIHCQSSISGGSAVVAGSDPRSSLGGCSDRTRFVPVTQRGRNLVVADQPQSLVVTVDDHSHRHIRVEHLRQRLLEGGAPPNKRLSG